MMTRERRIPIAALVVSLVTLFLVTACAPPEVFRFRPADLREIKAAGVIDLTELSGQVPTTPSSFYLEQIDDTPQRQLYQALKQAIGTFDDNVTFEVTPENKDLVDSTSLEEIYSLVYRDNPELFWMPVLKDDGITIHTLTDSYGGYVNLKIPWRVEPQVAEETTRQLNQWLANLKEQAANLTTDYQKAKFAYRQVVDYLEYDESTLDDQSLYSAFTKKRAVCAGYVKLYQAALNQLGVKSVWVPVTTKLHTDQLTNNHVVAALEFDGKWYWSDPTWGDAFSKNRPEFGSDWSSFSFDQKEFDRRYEITASDITRVPGCCKTLVNDSQKDTYFVHEGLEVNSLSQSEIDQVVKHGVDLSEGGYFQIAVDAQISEKFINDFEAGKLKLRDQRTGKVFRQIYYDKNSTSIMVAMD